nr:hypothetical protein [Micromonospora sp. DSM 115978]
MVNGGGYVDREYGIGRGRIDVLIRWPYAASGGRRTWQHEAVELKVGRAGETDPIATGLSQLDGYLDRLDLDRGTLVVFDRRSEASPITERMRIAATTSPAGRSVTLLRA